MSVPARPPGGGAPPLAAVEQGGPASAAATGYDADTRFIAAHHQPAVLIDLARSRGIDSHRLLRGTGLFYEDIATGRTLLSPHQFGLLVANACRLLDADDTPFLVGQRLLPGHYGAASDALRHAADLQEAVDTLIALRALLTPLLTPHWFVTEREAGICWIDACGPGDHARFALEAGMTAVVAMCRRLSGERLPWRFEFAYAAPRHVEQYWVHLGEQAVFGRELNMMSVPRACLATPWPDAVATAGLVARRQAAAQLDAIGMSASFLDVFRAYLHEHIREPSSLERAALAFGTSPAGLKRRLQKHGTHYQAQYDLVRKHVALRLQRIDGYSKRQIARYLNFHDATNFRRSFRRWIGVEPEPS